MKIKALWSYLLFLTLFFKKVVYLFFPWDWPEAKEVNLLFEAHFESKQVSSYFKREFANSVVSSVNVFKGDF